MEFYLCHYSKLNEDASREQLRKEKSMRYKKCIFFNSDFLMLRNINLILGNIPAREESSQGPYCENAICVSSIGLDLGP